jgi:hypothetical protein
MSRCNEEVTAFREWYTSLNSHFPSCREADCRRMANELQARPYYMYSMLDPIRLWYGLLARVGIILATSPLLWTIDSVVKIEHRNLQRVAMTLKIVKGG